jgi:hypothetical protein
VQFKLYQKNLLAPNLVIIEADSYFHLNAPPGAPLWTGDIDEIFYPQDFIRECVHNLEIR